MNRVYIISPYRGDLVNHVGYAHAAIADCLSRGESPYASHILLTQALDDDDPQERRLGMKAGLAWLSECHYAVAYTDFGVSEGMMDDIEACNQLNLGIERRSITFKLLRERTQERFRRCAELFGITPEDMRRANRGNGRIVMARDAFSYLCHEDRLHNKEIAALLNLSENSIYNCLARAECKMVDDAFFRSVIEELR